MKIRILEDLETKAEIAVVHKNLEDPRESITNLSQIVTKNKKQLVQVIFSDELVNEGEIGIPPNIAKRLGVKENQKAIIRPKVKSKGLDSIKKKFSRNYDWNKDDMDKIISDIENGNLSDLDMAAFTLAFQYHDTSVDETENLTSALAKFGENLEFEETVYDKHSIGGLPGNKVSLLIVPIIAAAGLLIPKTSSRAITSPSGTADTMEVLANVSFSADEIQELAPKVKGMIIWAGDLDLVPADSEIISRVERPLSLDPPSMIIASILSKKLSLNVNHLVLDLPTGHGTKVATEIEAKELARKFVEIGQRVGIDVVGAVTYGEQPLGYAVGPALEAREALRTLMNDGPRSVREKSIELAGILFESAKLAERGKGPELAHQYLKSGKALKKFREMLEVQNGDPNLKLDDIPVGQYTHYLLAKNDGYIAKISNNAVKQICKVLGCPVDKGAGIELIKKPGEYSKKNGKVIKLYSEREGNIDRALKLFKNTEFFTYEGMVLETISQQVIPVSQEKTVKLEKE